MSSLKSRVLVAVVGLPVLVWYLLWAPSLVMLVGLACLAAVGAMELQQCVSGRKETGTRVLSVLVATHTVAFCDVWPEHVFMVVALYVVVFFAYAIIKGGEVKFAQIMAGLFGSFAIGYSFAAFLRIEAMDLHRAWLLLPFILSFACDTFAYFVGCTIGKHKLAPKVSPKKSVEGAIGGLAGNVLCGCLFLLVMNHMFGKTISYGSMVILALCCGVVAQIGDLSFSLIKREYGIKDYGNMFLAHGGVLDRFDSVLFVTPVIEIILNFVR